MTVSEYKQLVMVFLFFMISLVIFRNTILAQYILTQETWAIYLDNFEKIYLNNYGWLDHLGIANAPLVISYHQLFVLFAHLLKLDLTKMIIVEYIILYGIAGIGMFLLCKYILSREYNNEMLILYSSFIAGVFYIFFPAFTVTRYMRLEVVYGYVIAPLIFLLFLKSIREEKMRYTIVSAILFSTIGFGARFYVYIILLLGSYITYNVLLDLFDKSEVKEFIKKLATYCISIILFISIFVLLKLTYILPSLMKVTSGTVTTLSTDLFSVRFQYANVLNLMRGLGNIWVPVLFKNPPIPSKIINPLSVLPGIFALFSLLLRDYGKKYIQRDSMFYALILIIFAFLFSNEFSIRNWIVLNAPFHEQIWRAFSSPKYQFYIGFSLSVLLAVSVYEIMLKLRKAKYSFSIIILILTSTIVPSWPLLTGDINSALHSVDLPTEYHVVNEWLKKQDGLFKVIWIPEFYSKRQPTWIEKSANVFDAWGITVYGSAKPTYHNKEMPFEYFYKFSLSYVDNSLLINNNTKSLSKLLSVIGVKYIVVHNDVKNVDVNQLLNTIYSDNDFKLKLSNNTIYIFENNKYAGRFFITPANNILVVCGGLKLLESLLESIVSHRENISAIPCDYMRMYNSVIEGSPKISFTNEKNIFDLVIHYVPEKYLIIPTKYTNHYDSHGKKWSKAYLSDPHHGAWSPFINTIPNHKWEFGYNLSYGFIFATERDDLEIPVNVEENNKYYLFARVLRNPKGGEMKINLANLSKTIDTREDVKAEFVWVKLGEIYLTNGKYTLEIENIKGSNAINILALIPEKEYYKAQKEVEKLLQNKTVIYLFEAESDLYRSNAEIARNINASNGELLTLNKNGKAWQDIEIIKNGTYKLALKGIGSFEISIGNITFRLNASSSNFTYTPMFHLERGTYRLEIKPLSDNAKLDVLWLYSTETNQTIDQLFEVKENPAKVISYEKINPTLWKVKVNATKPFMLSFAEAYDPLWEARVYKDGRKVETVKSIPLYSVINGFWINETGNLEITIRYKPQDWFEVGLMISATTFVGCVGYLFYDWRRERGDEWTLRVENSVRRVMRRK